LPGVGKKVFVKVPLKWPLLGIVPKVPVRGVFGWGENPRFVSITPDNALELPTPVI